MGDRAQKVKAKAYEKTPERFKNASSFQVRFRTGVIYVTLSFICIMGSKWSTMVFLAATAAVCAGELFYMLRSDAKKPNEVIGVVAAAAFPAAAFFFGVGGIFSILMIFILGLTGWYVFSPRSRVQDVGVCLFGSLYIGLQLACLMLIRMTPIERPWAGLLVLAIFFSIWANDAFAYMVGSKIGKHKMAPHISPKKSWEGFVAGLVASMGFWCLMTLIPGVSMPIPYAMAAGLVCGVASVMGDLCESRIKRSVGFKDSGTIMPGHGGLFDRCDSLMPTSVVAAAFLFMGGCIPLPF